MTAIIKLGGSVITFKNQPLKPNKKAISNLASVIRKYRKPLIIIHGAGSFGHYFAKKYKISTKEKQYKKIGVSKTKLAVMELNKILCDIFIEYGISVYPVPPQSFIERRNVKKDIIKDIECLAKSGYIPITYGDVLFNKGNQYILSGDKIAEYLSKYIKSEKVIFAIDKDGVLKNFQQKTIIKNLSTKDKFQSKKLKIDVTGGIDSKIKECFKISKLGAETYITNGLKPQNILNILENKEALYTKILP